MSLPEGTYAGIPIHPLKDGGDPGGHPFSGRVEVLTENGAGLLLVEGGVVIAAYYQDQVIELRGDRAIPHLLNVTGETDPQRSYLQYAYKPEEMEVAKTWCREQGLLAGEGEKVPGTKAPRGLDDGLLAKLSSQKGILAVSVFFEGFPIQSMGDMDFEHVAAMGEDFIRASRKMAQDMHLGALDQVILEGEEMKCIIAPYGDMFLCLFATADAHLGLIRLMIKNIQKELIMRV